jgi:hypothetical protein
MHVSDESLILMTQYYRRLQILLVAWGVPVGTEKREEEKWTKDR